MARFVVALIVGIVLVAAAVLARGHNDTDPPGGHSGLTVYTDNLTGCQYITAAVLSTPNPRMDGHGHQVGCRN